jgi:hypothetical protein
MSNFKNTQRNNNRTLQKGAVLGKFILPYCILLHRELADSAMTVSKSDEKKELKALLDREFSFLEILRQLRGCASAVPERSESLERLAQEIQTCHMQIFKRYFFPIDQTLNAFVKDLTKSREEMTTVVKEDQGKVLRFIEALEHELEHQAEEEVRDLKERLQQVRQMLGDA